ncbi:unnamed protein product [marine sediment metagenome]|uniref:Uncharacterized protein n=1 Tax=marine sediment metagenome TaxID=412755 RepID=X1RPI2_9ZZZZ
MKHSLKIKIGKKMRTIKEERSKIPIFQSTEWSKRREARKEARLNKKKKIIERRKRRAEKEKSEEKEAITEKEDD